MGPGIIEAFILNWLCPFSVCNEQDHIPWQCQPVQIRRKSSFLFCLNQSPKFQSNSNRVSLGLGEVEQDDVSATITEKMKTWPCCSEDLLTFPCEMPRCPATFSCLKISDHWKPICCNSLVGHGTNTHTHTHTFWSNGRNLPIPSVFQGAGALDVSDTCLRKWNTCSICHSNDWFSLPRKWESLGNACLHFKQ